MRNGPLASYTISQVINSRQSRFGLPHWTMHDLRRTALTQMGRLGVSPFIRGHVANHRTTTRAGVTSEVDDQYDYEREQREALELWAKRIAGRIVGGAEVVPMARPGR